MKKLSAFILAVILVIIPSCSGNQDGSAKIQTPMVDVAALEQELVQPKDELSMAQDTIARQQANLNEFALQVTNAAEQRDKAYEKISLLQRQIDSLKAMQVPWPGLNIYLNPERTISVKTDEEFIIKYDTGNELFITSLDEVHDEAFIYYIGRQGAWGIGNLDLPGVVWFSFKALKPGETQIKVSHLGHFGMGPINPETFNVVITE